MVKKIDHIAVMVPDMEEAKRMFKDGLGMELCHEESSEEWNSRYAFFQCGEVMIELIQPIGPGSNQDYLEQCGSGLHHICYEVDDIQEGMHRAERYFMLRDKEPQQGAFGSQICFLDPASILNIETELVAKSRSSGGGRND